MALPNLNDAGELPIGIHQATIDEVIAQFGSGTLQRETVCSEEVRKLLNHQQSENEFGASIFWIRPSLLLLETLDEFIESWQVKRDGTRRGIVEVRK